MTFLIDYLAALAHHRPGTFAGLVMLTLLCLCGLFHADKREGRRW
jgi:hypothetical protein